MQMQVSEQCPSCQQSAGIPEDADGDSVFPCAKCGTKLVVKANVGDVVCRVWLVTLESERIRCGRA